jgi:hypothetical protein
MIDLSPLNLFPGDSQRDVPRKHFPMASDVKAFSKEEEEYLKDVKLDELNYRIQELKDAGIKTTSKYNSEESSLRRKELEYWRMKLDLEQKQIVRGYETFLTVAAGGLETLSNSMNSDLLCLEGLTQATNEAIKSGAFAQPINFYAKSMNNSGAVMNTPLYTILTTFFTIIFQTNIKGKANQFIPGLATFTNPSQPRSTKTTSQNKTPTKTNTKTKTTTPTTPTKTNTKTKTTTPTKPTTPTKTTTPTTPTKTTTPTTPTKTNTKTTTTTKPTTPTKTTTTTKPTTPTKITTTTETTTPTVPKKEINIRRRHNTSIYSLIEPITESYAKHQETVRINQEDKVKIGKLNELLMI